MDGVCNRWRKPIKFVYIRVLYPNSRLINNGRAFPPLPLANHKNSVGNFKIRLWQFFSNDSSAQFSIF